MNQQYSTPPIQDYANPFFDAGHFGYIGGKLAATYHVLGRRNGFNSTSVQQDVGEWLTGAGLDTFPELTGAESLEVVSSSANDAAAGTGTRSIQIRYLDTNFALQNSAPITLNGITPVAVSFKATFIYAMAAYTGGSSPESAGNIVLRIAGGGAIQEQISAGNNRSLSGRFMVPAGYHAFLPYWGLTAIGTATQDAKLRATVNLDRTLGTRYVSQDIDFVQSASVVHNDLPWGRFPSLSKIKASTLPSATAAGNRLDIVASILVLQN